MEIVDHIIKTKWIITCEEENRILENHALLIKDKKILDILPEQEVYSKYSSDNPIDYPNHVVLPGLINCHTHLAMNLFRGLADDLDLMDWLNNYIWPAEAKWVSHEMVLDGSLLAIAELIRGGVTCFNDMYFFPEASAEAAIRAGIRAFIGMTVIDVPTAWAKTTDEYFKKGMEFYEQYKNNALITPTMAPHSTYTVSLENLKKCKNIAEKHGLKINIHLQEAPSEIEASLKLHNKRPLQRLNDINMLSEQLIAIHMTQINEEDINILLQTRPHIIHCPESNMKLVSGACPIEKLSNLTLNVALGTDGAASNNDLDMFGEMRTAAFLGKITADDSKAVSAETLLKMATLHGAKALGMDHIIGSLAPKKEADFIAIDLETIETQPLYKPISQLVYSTARNQVTDVWVKGKRILKDRKLQGIDEKELINKAKVWRKKIKN